MKLSVSNQQALLTHVFISENCILSCLIYLLSDFAFRIGVTLAKLEKDYPSLPLLTVKAQFLSAISTKVFDVLNHFERTKVKLMVSKDIQNGNVIAESIVN